jgi:hypothetical protein
LAAAILAGGAVAAAALGVVSQWVGRSDPAVDCTAYVKQLTELAAENPNMANLVTATTPSGKRVISFGREGEVCGAPGPIINGLAKSTTTVVPATTTTHKP